MKKIIGILVMAFMVSFTTNAQMKQGNRQKMSNLSPEEIATLQTKQMTLNLDLTKSQQTKIYDLKLKQAKERDAKRAEFRQKRVSGVKPTDEERYNFRNAQLDNQIAFKAELKNILNKEQYEKWEKTAGTKARMYPKNKDCKMKRN